MAFRFVLDEANYCLLRIGSVVVCELRDDALSFYRK